MNLNLKKLLKQNGLIEYIKLKYEVLKQKNKNKI